MKRNVRVYLKDMYQYAQKALQLVDGLDLEAFSQDWKTQWAVIRALEIIGEAARYIPETFRQQHPEIPWRQMVGLRNVLIHRYFDLDITAIWDTVTRILPDVLKQLEALLQSFPEGGSPNAEES